MYSGGKPAGKHSRSEREMLSINSDSWGGGREKGQESEDFNQSRLKKRARNMCWPKTSESNLGMQTSLGFRVAASKTCTDLQDHK